jgi:hypothetical protein
MSAGTGSSAPRKGWTDPANLISIVAAIISVIAAGTSIYTGRETIRSNKIQAETALAADSDIRLQTVKAEGIDPPKLEHFFYLLYENKENGRISQEFYNIKITEWCPVTRLANKKLQISWINNLSFKDKYKEAPEFLAMVTKLVGKGADDKEECL